MKRAATAEVDDVVLDVGDARYTLAFDCNAICEMERVMSSHEGRIVTAAEALAAARKQSYRYVRGLLYGGLLKHHPDASLVLAGDLIATLGGPQAVFEKLKPETERGVLATVVRRQLPRRLRHARKAKE